MKALNNTKKSRFKMAIYTVAFLGLLAVSCIVVTAKTPEVDLSTVATTCVAGILTIVTMFIGGDSYRKSGE